MHVFRRLQAICNLNLNLRALVDISFTNSLELELGFMNHAAQSSRRI